MTCSSRYSLTLLHSFLVLKPLTRGKAISRTRLSMKIHKECFCLSWQITLVYPVNFYFGKEKWIWRSLVQLKHNICASWRQSVRKKEKISNIGIMNCVQVPLNLNITSWAHCIRLCGNLTDTLLSTFGGRGASPRPGPMSPGDWGWFPLFSDCL